jgi:hypothetical protein
VVLSMLQRGCNMTGIATPAPDILQDVEINDE